MPSLSVTEFPIPTANSTPFSITAGPDGNIWFTETGGNKIGRISLAGTITEFSAPGAPGGITAGPDGALWFTEIATGLGAVGLDFQVGGIAADPPTGNSTQVAQLVQAMAGFGGGGAGEGLNTTPFGADTSQQPSLTTPQHT
jgi:streptogramin lyase